MSFQPTKQQELAIEHNGSIIVSAAAGSGKTAVLVERVIRMLTDSKNPVMADRLLVVTFTNAAAAELRYRIEKRLVEEVDKHPDNILLQKQRILISNAKISTIDSFCIDFLKENFEKSNISPNFKIADNSTIHSLENAAMTQLINQQFETGDEAFLNLLTFMGEEYDDSKLRNCIYQIYNFSRHMPNPNEWLDNIYNEYSLHAHEKSDKWYTDALKYVEDIATDACLEISNAIRLLKSSDSAYEKYFANYNYFYALSKTVIELCADGDWDEVYNNIVEIKPPRCKSLTQEEKTNSVIASIKGRDNAKNNLNKIKDIVYSSKQQICQEFMYTLPYLKKIIELVCEFEKLLYGLLLKQDLITFYMAEQSVLDILKQFGEEYKANYDAVMVDEYQDTNTLQDTLFNILSDNGRKLFCVGDMKQCIYKFRGSNPLSFLSKKESAQFPENLKPDEALRVDLGCNFRSRPEICEYINSIFKKLIYKKNSGFDYDENEQLVPLAKYPNNNDTKVETHFIDYKSISEKSSCDIKDKLYAEAHVVADIISETIDKEPFLRDGEGLRKADYKDITILVRSMRGKGEIFMNVLKERGIPVSASASDALESDEVNVLLSLLKVINNPTDDIALLTVLTSNIFSFSMEELSKIRAAHKYGNFFSSVMSASKNGNIRATEFINIMSVLRRKNLVMPVSQLIDEVFEETNLLNIVSTTEGGDIKRLNLLCVQNLANSFEQDGRRDLKSFLNYIDNLENRDFSLSYEGGNCVTVMSIHKSKGLQFPVCIVANTSNQFNQQDIRDSVITSEDYGFSLVYCDANGDSVDNSIIRSVMKNEEKKSLLAEELRIFYVALTRAEEKLIITASFDDLDVEVNKKISLLNLYESSQRVEYPLFLKNISYSDWVIESLLIDSNGECFTEKSNNPNIVIHRKINIPMVHDEDTDPYIISEEKIDKICDIFGYEYPFAELLSLQSKASVTEIVHKADDKIYRFSRRPAFMHSKGLNSAEKGTAVHKFMQQADLVKCKTDLTAEIERLYENMYLSEAEYKSIDTKILKEFFESELYNRIIESKNVKREMRFLTEFSAKELKDGLAPICNDEMIVVQGAVDLLFEEDGKLVIVDFKTDRNKDEKALTEAYADQLRIYAKACSKILKLPVSQLILHSFFLNKSIKIEK